MASEDELWALVADESHGVLAATRAACRRL